MVSDIVAHAISLNLRNTCSPLNKQSSSSTALSVAGKVVNSADTVEGGSGGGRVGGKSSARRDASALIILHQSVSTETPFCILGSK